ncbi:MAG: hypothetical protein RLZZ26_439 [Candidatus Parcubacteria bacterium]|jgi:hypothetical protein
MNTNMNTESTSSPVRQVATNGLAVVGFVALVTAGLWLAVYSTRFVPVVVNRIGAAAVYLGSVFTPASGSTVSVVPTPTSTTTIPFGTDSTSGTGATASIPATTTTTAVATTPVKTPVKPAPVKNPVSTGSTGTDTYQISGTAKTAPYGDPDLAVAVVSTGYLTQASTDSFVASTTVPLGDRAAVHFTVTNIGTNWSGTWTFSASIPTRPAYTFHSPVQQSLAPGDSVDYTLGFDQAVTGPNQVITITIDPIGIDSNANNNTTSAGMTVLGS